MPSRADISFLRFPFKNLGFMRFPKPVFAGYKRCKVTFQCPHGLELLPDIYYMPEEYAMFQCPHGLELLRVNELISASTDGVSMPSRAYTSFLQSDARIKGGMLICNCFNALSGLYIISTIVELCKSTELSNGVSMPSRAWVVTARMSNILIFLWYFLCIPAICKCILAYLPIFSTNYLSFWGANPLVLFLELAFRTTLLSFYW